MKMAFFIYNRFAKCAFITLSRYLVGNFEAIKINGRCCSVNYPKISSLLFASAAMKLNV